MESALCTGVQSCWNRNGLFPNCTHKVGSIKLRKISWFAEALRVTLIGTKGAKPIFWKEPHTIIIVPPPPNLLSHYCHTSTLSLQPPNPDPFHRTARQRIVIHHSREHVATALQSSGGVLRNLDGYLNTFGNVAYIIKPNRMLNHDVFNVHILDS